jgi:hypothetical protein
MTDHQRAVAEALSRCSFLPGSHDKRFARDMGASARQTPTPDLTERQATHLDRLAFKYRRQMPAHLVPSEKPQ